MRLSPHIGAKQLGLLAALFIVGAIFYLASLHDTFPGDLDALRNFQSFRSPWLDGAAVVASALARSLTVYLSIPAVSLFLWLGRRRADAAAVLLVFLSEGINLGLKELVGRPRPDFSLLASPPERPCFSQRTCSPRLFALRFAHIYNWRTDTASVVEDNRPGNPGAHGIGLRSLQGLPGGPLAQRCAGGLSVWRDLYGSHSLGTEKAC